MAEMEQQPAEEKTGKPGIGMADIWLGIFNIVIGAIAFWVIGFQDQSMTVNLVIFAIVQLGLLAGFVVGIILLSAGTKRGKGLFTLITAGVMFLFTIVDGLFMFWNVVEKTEGKNKDESEIYTVEKPESDLNQADIQSDTVIWINAVYAIPTYADSRDYRFIGGTNPENANYDNLSSMLESAWGVTDRISALECVNRLLERGHQAKYQEYLQELERQGLSDMEEDDLRRELEQSDLEEKTRNQYIIAYRIAKEQPENGILAWDYCRAVQQLGYYYVMDYITLEECMEKSLDLAKEIQAAYSSWEDMANSYLLGYEFWSGQEASDWSTEAYERKSEYEDIMKYDAYIFAMDWNYALEDTWSGAKHTVSEEDVCNVVEEAYAGYVERMGYEIETDHWLLGKEDVWDEAEDDLGEEDIPVKETGAPSEDFVEEQTAALNNNLKAFVAAGVPMEIGMSFGEIMDKVEYKRLVSPNEKIVSYETIYLDDGEAKESIMLDLYSDDENPQSLGEMYIESVMILQPFSEDLDILTSHSVLANGIHIGSTRKELNDVFARQGVKLDWGEDGSQGECEIDGYRYGFLMDNVAKPLDEDIVIMVSIQPIY